MIFGLLGTLFLFLEPHPRLLVLESREPTAELPDAWVTDGTDDLAASRLAILGSNLQSTQSGLKQPPTDS